MDTIPNFNRENNTNIDTYKPEEAHQFLRDIFAGYEGEAFIEFRHWKKIKEITNKEKKVKKK